MGKYSGLHRRQLFHWVGKHIEEKVDMRKGLTDSDRRKYLECLHGSIEKGIWVKQPEEPDGLLDRSVVKADRPMACFTEWSVSESMHHALRYGRLGLGFSRSFILKWGGRPVAYLPATQKDPATRSILQVAKFLQENGDDEIKRHWRALSQFLKPMRPYSAKKPSTVKNGDKENHKKEAPAEDSQKAMKRSFGGVMPYLEEREWRIVHDGRKIDLIPARQAETGRFYLPYKPGEDLYTLVLPDHGTYALMTEDPNLMKLLFCKGQPPVTILTLDDMDTF